MVAFLFSWVSYINWNFIIIKLYNFIHSFNFIYTGMFSTVFLSMISCFWLILPPSVCGIFRSSLSSSQMSSLSGVTTCYITVYRPSLQNLLIAGKTVCGLLLLLSDCLSTLCNFRANIYCIIESVWLGFTYTQSWKPRLI